MSIDFKEEAGMKKLLQAVLFITSIFLGSIGCYAEEPLEVITPNVPARVSYQPSADDMLIVSVSRWARQPDPGSWAQ